jgi:hypothetical protein
MLEEYDIEVMHLMGLMNMDVDGWSKNPCPRQLDVTWAWWHEETNVKDTC